MLSILKPFFFLNTSTPRGDEHATSPKNIRTLYKLSGRICHHGLLSNCHDLFTKNV